MEYAMANATIVKVRRHGQGAKGTESQATGRSKGGMTTKILAFTGALGNLVRCTATDRPSRAHRPKNRSPASARRSSRAGPLHRPSARPRRVPHRTHRSAFRQSPRHRLTRFGCTPYCCPNSASVLSRFTAATATLALNAGLRFRRGRLLILPPARGQHGRCQIGNPLIPMGRFPELPFPSQGWGRGFESLRPLQFSAVGSRLSRSGFRRVILPDLPSPSFASQRIAIVVHGARAC